MGAVVDVVVVVDRTGTVVAVAVAVVDRTGTVVAVAVVVVVVAVHNKTEVDRDMDRLH